MGVADEPRPFFVGTQHEGGLAFPDHTLVAGHPAILQASPGHGSPYLQAAARHRDGSSGPDGGIARSAGPRALRNELVKDPVCATYVPRRTAVVRTAGPATYYFCSTACAA